MIGDPYVSWSPLPARPPLIWPNRARIAVCVIVSLEQLEWHPREPALVPPSARYGGPYPAVFDPLPPTMREYGNRVGVFRVMEVLDRHGITATVAMDSVLAEQNQYLVAQCLKRNWEFIGHGLTASQMVSAKMGDDEEREYLESALSRLTAATGQSPQGWLGVDYAESHRTVRLLAELGVRYVCDWPNDEQPYPMSVPKGDMTALPVAIGLDEVFSHRFRGLPIARWGQLVRDTFDGLRRGESTTGRVLVLSLHPYLIGQPFRIGQLDAALQHIVGHDGVWSATGGEIVDWYRRQTSPGQQVT